MPTDDLPEAIATKARPVFRSRAMIASDVSGGLPEDVVGAMPAAPPLEPSERQKENQKEKLHLEKEWDRLDREYAEINLKKIASVHPVEFGIHPAVAPRPIEYSTWRQALGWIKHRCREKLNVTGTNWYDDDTRLDLTAAIQRGEIDCFDPDSWLKVPQHRAFDREREPNVLFRADDLIARWPAAFLDPFPEVVAEYYRRSGKSPSSEDVSPDCSGPDVRAAETDSVETRDPERKEKLGILREMIDEDYRPRRNKYRNISMAEFAYLAQLRFSAPPLERLQITAVKLSATKKRIPIPNFFPQTIRKDLRQLAKDPVYGPKLKSPGTRPTS